MEIDYNLPLELNCLAARQRATSTGTEVYVEIFKTCVQWEDIVAIEEFINHEQFPQEESVKEKVIIITKIRPYIIRENVFNVSQNWGHYKIWKSKQVHKSIFSAN